MVVNNPRIAYSISSRAQYPNQAEMLGTISSAIGGGEGIPSGVRSSLGGGVVSGGMTMVATA
jgi:hypothetical protein